MAKVARIPLPNSMVFLFAPSVIRQIKLACAAAIQAFGLDPCGGFGRRRIISQKLTLIETLEGSEQGIVSLPSLQLYL
jgi:hypothetical protein